MCKKVTMEQFGKLQRYRVDFLKVLVTTWKTQNLRVTTWNFHNNNNNNNNNNKEEEEEDGPSRGLILNVDKTEFFWPREDPRSREHVFPPNISRPHAGVKLLGGPVSIDRTFCHEFSMKRVSKTIGLMTAVSKTLWPTMWTSPSLQLCRGW